MAKSAIEGLGRDLVLQLAAQRAGKKRCAVVAMSGGVDSTLTAKLYQAAGYQVIGITMQLYNPDSNSPGGKTCCAGRDLMDARQSANALGIDHYLMDLRAEFKQRVLDDFVASYRAGLTPIPCIRCNQFLKFETLLGLARDLGADELATGHYVRRIRGSAGWELHCGSDASKDQSYFLFATTPAQLEFCNFPLGGLQKSATRRLAAAFGLRVASKPESQDICFVPDGNYAALLTKLDPSLRRQGAIVDSKGKVLGKHDGIVNFTIGQRRGLGLGGVSQSTAALYVLHLDAERAEVCVGKRSELRVRRFPLANLSWLIPPPQRKIDITVRYRSNMRVQPAWLLPPDSRSENDWQVDIPAGAEAVAPGQACVFYRQSRLLGGGWIKPRSREQVLAA